MTQFIKFEQRVVKIFKGEMRGYDVGIWVIGGMLNGTKIIDVIFFGYNDDTARMLTGGSFDTDAFFCQSIDFSFTERKPAFLGVF